MALVPVCAYRQFFGYGKIRAGDIPVDPKGDMAAGILASVPLEEEAWAVMEWKRFEDGHEEPGLVEYLCAGATEKDARKAAAEMIRFHRMSKEDLLALGECIEAKEEDEDRAFIETRFPNFQAPLVGPGAIEANDLYQARLKVLAGLQPKTVNLVQRADEAKNPDEKQKLEREAIDAYFGSSGNRVGLS